MNNALYNKPSQTRHSCLVSEFIKSQVGNVCERLAVQRSFSLASLPWFYACLLTPVFACCLIHALLLVWGLSVCVCTCAWLPLGSQALQEQGPSQISLSFFFFSCSTQHWGWCWDTKSLFVCWMILCQELWELSVRRMEMQAEIFAQINWTPPH